MADISKIVLPNNSEYNFKDSEARTSLLSKVEFTQDSYIGAVIPEGGSGGGTSVTSETVSGWGFIKASDVQAMGFALSTDIPSDEHINSLINVAIGAIENGTY